MNHQEININFPNGGGYNLAKLDHTGWERSAFCKWSFLKTAVGFLKGALFHAVALPPIIIAICTVEFFKRSKRPGPSWMMIPTRVMVQRSTLGSSAYIHIKWLVCFHVYKRVSTSDREYDVARQALLIFHRSLFVIRLLIIWFYFHYISIFFIGRFQSDCSHCGVRAMSLYIRI